MKPVLEYLPRETGQSFVTKFFDYPYFPTPWHFHPEYELVLVVESTGKRYIGNQISNFEPGNLVLLGPFLPHTYQNAPEYLSAQSHLRAKSIVVHFREDSFGEGFLCLPESQKIAGLLKRANLGVAINGQTNQLISELMHNLVKAHGFEKWLTLIKILNILSDSPELEHICSNVFSGQNESESARMNAIIGYVWKNFQSPITISDVAKIVNMAENSFSRYFSQRTRKPFVSYLNEVRLNFATKLLIESTKSITEISLESGFNNLSNFNRQFRAVYQDNPTNYRKNYQKKLL